MDGEIGWRRLWGAGGRRGCSGTAFELHEERAVGDMAGNCTLEDKPHGRTLHP